MDDLKKVDVNINPFKGENIVKFGNADPVIPLREKVVFSGNLDTALNYLKNPPFWWFYGEISSKRAVNEYESFPSEFSKIVVDREYGSIELKVDEGMPWESTYFGKLVFTDVFKRFGINQGKSFTTFELSDLIKMHRSFFETKDKAMLLASELRNFKAKVDKQLELSDDNRGNKKALVAQIVDSNIPTAFKMMMPVFKGFENYEFEVEININASDFSCTLISPEVNDFVHENTNQLIDDQLIVIRELHPTLKIFEK